MPRANLPNGLTLLDCPQYVDIYPELCSYDNSFYMYRINIGANAAFLGLFSLSLLGYLVVFAFTRRNIGFTISLCLGVICEILGYVGRIMSWQNQWSENGFLIQICCLTIGPAFMAAGIYFCLRSIVLAFGAENSRVKPEMYPRIFIPCDVISLVLQALGGALASIGSQNNNKSQLDLGDNIMIAGLAFQSFTLLVFMVLAIDFAVRTIRRPAGLDHDPMLVELRASWPFRLFLAALSLSTICIFWRSVFRCAELSGGWTGSIMGNQNLFIGFEGVMVIVAVAVLNVFHPNLCFPQMDGRKFGSKSDKRWASSGENVGDLESKGAAGTSQMRD